MNKYEVALQHFDDELTGCQFNGSDLIIDLEDAKLIKELLEQKFDKENTITEIFNEGFLEYDEENQEFVYQPCYVNESIEKIKKLIEGD